MTGSELRCSLSVKSDLEFSIKKCNTGLVQGRKPAIPPWGVGCVCVCGVYVEGLQDPI